MKALIIILCLIYALFLTQMFTHLLIRRRSYFISRIRKHLLIRRYHVNESDIQKL